MNKRIFTHALYGAIIYGIGFYWHGNGGGDLAAILGGAGFGYACISVSMFVLIPCYKLVKPQLYDRANERIKTKTYDDILRLKKLLDENIISQQEYDAKVQELKAKFLS